MPCEPATLNLNVAEDILTLLEQIVPKYTHILVPSTNHGKNYLLRLAALFDSAPMMDVLDVVDENTFKRPMYAGNAIATMKMSNPIKVSTSCSACGVRSTYTYIKFVCHTSS